MMDVNSSRLPPPSATSPAGGTLPADSAFRTVVAQNTGAPVEVLGNARDEALELRRVNGEFIGRNGDILRVSDETGYLEALKPHMIESRAGSLQMMVSGPVVAVNGVTVPATTAHANAQRVANRLGTPVIALYNGPHTNIPNEEGANAPTRRWREFAGAGDHSDRNNGIDGQNLAVRLARIMVEHVDSGSFPLTSPLTVVGHSEGVSFTRAAFDNARQMLISRGMSGQEAEQTLRDHVDFIGLGPGSSRQSNAVDGVYYLNLDDRVVGGLGLTRNWGSDATVVFRMNEGDNNHFAPGYISQIRSEALRLDPGFYFQDAQGQISDLVVIRETISSTHGRTTSHRLAPVDANGAIGQPIVRTTGASRIAGLFSNASESGLPVERSTQSLGAASKTTETIRLSDLEAMPGAFSGRERAAGDDRGDPPATYEPDWQPRDPNWSAEGETASPEDVARTGGS